MDTSYYTLSFTINSQPVRKQVGGRNYLVVSATILRPQVIPGSKGPLYYPPTENGKYDGDHWNRIPLVVWHPKDDAGNPISARTPEVINEYGIGDFYGATNNSGVVSGKAYFDEELTARFDNKLPQQQKILPRVLAGLPIELSTGLYTENELAPTGSHHNGIPYTHVARGHRADHIAVLPDQVGACGVKDGCGFNVVTNKTTTDVPELDTERMGTLKTMWEHVVNALTGQPRSSNSGQYKVPGSGTGKDPEHTYAQRGAMQLTDEDYEYGTLAATEITANPDNPVSWVEDASVWDKAKAAAIKSNDGDNHSIVAHIYRQMGGKKKTVITNSVEDVIMPTKVENVQYLTTNCDCWKGKGTILNALPDKDVEAFRNQIDIAKDSEQVVNAVKETFGDKFKNKTGSELVINAMPAFIKKKMKDVDDDDDDDDNDDDEYEMIEGKRVKKKIKGTVMNKQEIETAVANYLKGLTPEQYRANAPADIQEMLTNSANITKKYKHDLVAKLVANVAESDRTEVVATLISLPLATLEKMTPLANAQAKAPPVRDEVHEFMVNYYGAQGGPINQPSSIVKDDKPIINEAHIGLMEMPELDYDAISVVGNAVRNYNTVKTA